MQMENVTIAGTSTSKIYNPTNSDSNIAVWKDRTSGIPVGFPVLTASLREPGNAGGNYKAAFRLKIPTLEIASGPVNGFVPAATKAYDVQAVVEVIIPDRCTLTERSELAAQLRSFLSSAVFTAMAVNLEQVY